MIWITLTRSVHTAVTNAKTSCSQPQILSPHTLDHTYPKRTEISAIQHTHTINFAPDLAYFIKHKK